MSGSTTSSSDALSNSYVLSKNVLQSDLASAVKNPNDFFKLIHMMSVPVITAFDVTQKDIVQAHFDKNVALVQTSTPKPLEAVLRGINVSSTDTSLDSIFTRVRSMCWELVKMQINANFTTNQQFSQTILINLVSRHLSAILDSVDAQIPFKTESNGLVTLDQHNAEIDKIIQGYVGDTTKIPSDLSTLFEPPTTGVFYQCMRPYFLLKFIGSMLRGTWNKAGNISSVMFYDVRYAELTLYRTISALFTTLYDQASGNSAVLTKVAGSAAAGDTLKTNLATLRDGYNNILSTKLITMSKVLMESHGEVAKLSNLNKNITYELNSVNDDFKFRKQSLKSLASTVEPMKAKLFRSKIAFIAWIVAYAIIVIVSALLMATGRYESFFIMAILALLIVLLYVTVNMSIVLVRRFMKFARNKR